MLDLGIALIALLLGLVGTVSLVRGFPDKFLRANFQQRKIPTACGLLIVVSTLVSESFASLIHREILRTAMLFLLASVGFGLLGLIDDLLGDRSVGGLKGHFRALLSGKVTTGTVKAIGGIVIALICGWVLHPHGVRALIAAILIAGFANCSNLLDLRPGRCLASILIGAVIVTVFIARGSGPIQNIALPFWYAMLPAIALIPGERRGLFMLGDTGANSIGAILGLSFAIYLPPWAQIVGVVYVIAFHVWTEKHSINKLIQSRPILRSIDRKIGVR